MSDAQPTEAPAASPTPAPAESAPDRPGAGPAHRAAGELPHVTRTVKHGAVVAEPARAEGDSVRTLRSSSTPARSFTEHQRQMLANLDKYDSLTAPAGGDPAEREPPAATPAPAGAEQPAPAKPSDAAPATPPDPDLPARAARLAEHNKRLVARVEQLEQHRGGDPDERLQALDAIERGLTTDTLGSIRKLVALNIGAKDAAAPEVDRIMAGVYAEWTAAELKVEMDPARRALLESERNRLLIERDKRDRDAGSKASEARVAAEREQQHHADIGRRLDAHLSEAKHADRFPLLMKHARTFDGQAPGELLYTAIRRGIAAGEFPAGTDDATLINHYSKEIETHYKGLRDQIAEPATSTAAPAPAPVPPTDKKADATETGVRTITNASASVAPPAPPAKPTTPDPTDKPNPKKWRNETERRASLAKHYFPDD
jgi:hypothetical protein